MYVEGAIALNSHILQGKYNGEIAAINACQVLYHMGLLKENEGLKWAEKMELQ